ncbi:hypothetical protein ABZ768_32375, partial [Streptomyces griseoaurantiacus]
RRDMGQLDAAIVTLQSPELASTSVQPWTARLRAELSWAVTAPVCRTGLVEARAVSPSGRHRADQWGASVV